MSRCPLRRGQSWKSVMWNGNATHVTSTWLVHQPSIRSIHLIVPYVRLDTVGRMEPLPMTSWACSVTLRWGREGRANQGSEDVWDAEGRESRVGALGRTREDPGPAEMPGASGGGGNGRFLIQSTSSSWTMFSLNAPHAFEAAFCWHKI